MRFNRLLAVVCLLALLCVVAFGPRVYAQSGNVIGRNLSAIEDKSTVLRADAVSSASNLTLYIVWSETAAAGTVVIEAAHDPGYRGTWARLVEIPWSGANRVDEFAISGVHIAVRARITQTITSGSVSVHEAHR